MENYIVSARKYRPRTFDSVVGQSALTTTLKNAIATGKLAHAYLFCGPRGVGKTTCARIFAKAINCMNPGETGEPCDQCESCLAFNENRSFNIVELDAASNNSVEDIRSLIEQAQMPPQVGKYKVFIIDEVHMLSTGAFNAFLKTLEEPPAHDIFILATTEKHKLLPTILSRCQIYDFKRMEVPDIVAHLKFVANDAGVSYEEEALNVIAQKADGGMRDALSIFDQVVGFSGGNVTYHKVIEDLNVLDYEYYFSLTDSLLKADVPAALLTLNDILGKGFSGQHFISGLATHFRDLLVSRDPSTLPLLDVAESVRERYREQAARCQPRFLMTALRLCNDCDLGYRTAGNKRLLVEITLIRAAQLMDAADDAPGSGLGPTIALKPISKTAGTTVPTPQTLAPATDASAHIVQNQPANAPAQPIASQSTPSEPATAESPASYMPTSNPIASPPVISTTPSDAPQALAAPQISTSIPVSTSTSPTSTTTVPAQKTPSASAFSRVKTLSLSGAAPAQTATPEATETSVVPQTHNNAPFTIADVRRVWQEFADALPQEQRAMAERMKGIEPQADGESKTAVEVVVENRIVLDQLNALRPQLLAFLRNRVDNAEATLNFRLRDIEEKHRAFSQREQFNEMLEKNVHFSRLNEKLALELI